MRSSRLKTTVAMALLTFGVSLVGVSDAANLDENLIADPGFETVNTGDTRGIQCCGGGVAVRLRSWFDKSGDGDDNFAVNYSQNGAKGLKPPNAGRHHYYGGFDTLAGEVNVFQQIDLSQGDTAVPSALGSGRYYLSGFFTSFETRTEATTVRAVFSNSIGELGTATIGGERFVSRLPVSSGERSWGQHVSCGEEIPQGTDHVEIQLISSGADRHWEGFVDNVDFQVYLTPLLLGDFDGDGQLGLPDIDVLGKAIADGSVAPRLDLSDDCVVNGTDLDTFLGLVQRLPGDADFSGDVGFADFLILSSHFETTGAEAAWSKGDFIPDNRVTFTDFLVLSNNFGASSPTGIAAVPEPASCFVLVLAAGCFVLGQRR